MCGVSVVDVVCVWGGGYGGSGECDFFVYCVGCGCVCVCGIKVGVLRGWGVFVGVVIRFCACES